MNNKIVYISGPMTGLKDFGRQNFYNAEAFLKECGYIVLNPATMPFGMEYKQYMAIAIAMLQQADTIIMLPGWEHSRGACIEKAYAEACGIKIDYLDRIVYEYNTVCQNINNNYIEAV